MDYLQRFLNLFHFKKDNDDVTEEDVIDLIQEGHEQGVFKSSEATMIQNIFEFDDKMARDIMVNRKNVVAIEGHDRYLILFLAMTLNHGLM